MADPMLPGKKKERGTQGKKATQDAVGKKKKNTRRGSLVNIHLIHEQPCEVWYKRFKPADDRPQTLAFLQRRLCRASDKRSRYRPSLVTAQPRLPRLIRLTGSSINHNAPSA